MNTFQPWWLTCPISGHISPVNSFNRLTTTACKPQQGRVLSHDWGDTSRSVSKQCLRPLRVSLASFNQRVTAGPRITIREPLYDGLCDSGITFLQRVVEGLAGPTGNGMMRDSSLQLVWEFNLSAATHHFRLCHIYLLMQKTSKFCTLETSS